MTTTATPTPRLVGDAGAPRVDAGRRRRVRQYWPVTPYLFLLPALALLGVFFLWPAVTAVQLAFYDYRVVSPAEFVGLDNFSHMLSDPRFLTSLKNSGLYLVGMLPILVGVPLLLAVLVNLPLRGIKFFRLVYYLPVVTSMVAVAIAWNYVYHERGMLNWLLSSLGLLDRPVQYLLEPGWALPALILVESWKSLGYMQIFTSVFVMTQGGPQDATLSLGYYIYDEAFRRFNMGYVSAMGLVLWAILVVFSLVSYRLTRGKVVAG